jgi:hypothetical protein
VPPASKQAESVSDKVPVGAERQTGSSQEKSKRPRAPRKPRGAKEAALIAAAALVEQNGPELKRALTVDAAVEAYSISRSSLYLLIKAGTLPDIKLAGRRLIPRDALECLISGKI